MILIMGMVGYIMMMNTIAADHWKLWPPVGAGRQIGTMLYLSLVVMLVKKL